MLFEPKRHDMFADFLIRHVCSQNELGVFPQVGTVRANVACGSDFGELPRQYRTPFAAQMRIDS